MIRSFGEAALLVELDGPELAQSLAASLRADPPPAMREAIPGLSSVLVELDPLSGDADVMAVALEARLAGIRPLDVEGRLHRIPVTYNGPDLDEVAELSGMSRDEVVSAHTSVVLRVLFCGFAPGFAYLGDLPDRLRVGRLETPRTTTPPGSVAVAGTMTAIYPAALPGGWRIIGNATLTLFDPRSDRPALLVPGDRVQFEPA